jgi:hypothetical protein
MSKVRSSTSKTSSSSKTSFKGLSGKGAGKVGGGGKAGKASKIKSGLGKVSGGKSTKSKGTKSSKGKTSSHKSQKAAEMQNPFKELGNFLGNVLGTVGGPQGVKGSSGRKSGGSKAAGRSGSGKSQKTGSSGAGKSRKTGSSGAGKSQKTGKSQTTGKTQKSGGTTGSNKTGSKDSVKKSPSDTGQKTSPEQVKGQEKTPTGQDGRVMGTAKGTGYYPSNSKMEGGYVDKQGKKLSTLQDFLDGKSKSVSIALDKNLYKSGQVKYGDSFTIPELDKKYGKHIDFRAVDTGGAFTNKEFSRVDICTGSKKDSLDPTINGKLTLIKSQNPDSPLGKKLNSPEGVKALEQNKKSDTGKQPGGLPGGTTVEPGKVPGDTLGTTPPRGRSAIEKMFGPAGKNQVNMKMPAGPGGKMINVTCNSKIAPKLNAVYQEIKEKGLSGDIKGYDGCYNYRNKRNSNNLSTHAWGIAVDVNAGSHPMGSSKQSSGQKAIAEIFQKHGFYQLPNDPMHFQFCRGY